MEDLAGVIKRGGPDRPLYKYLEERPDFGQANAQYQKANAKLVVGPITQTVTVPDSARRLLDMGGSHGLYSIGFCKRNPNLQAVVFDMPVALVDTEAAIASEGLTDRISVHRGDYIKDDIGQGYDVILCFFLVHNHTEDENKLLVAKAAKALNPGGMIVIHEMLRNEPPNQFDALYSLLFFMYSGTRNYSFTEISGWLQKEGLGNFRSVDVSPTRQTSIIVGVKPR